MQYILWKHKQLWTNGEYLMGVAQGLLLIVMGASCTVAARAYLLKSSIHPVSSPDLLLDMLPTMGMENFLVWGLPMFVAFTLSLAIPYPQRIPFSLKAIGLLFIIRSFSVILTPMGIRPDQVLQSAHGLFQNLAYASNDFFFSGHVSFPLLMALIFWQETWVRTFLLSTTLLFAIAVLLAHTHYSIDVLSVPLIVPSIYRLSLRLFGTIDAPIPLKKKNATRPLTQPSVA